MLKLDSLTPSHDQKYITINNFAVHILQFSEICVYFVIHFVFHMEVSSKNQHKLMIMFTRRLCTYKYIHNVEDISCTHISKKRLHLINLKSFNWIFAFLI